VRRPIVAVVAFVGVLLAGCATAGAPAAGPSTERSLILATTTSTQDSGLLDELLPAFSRDTGWQVKTLAVGSGQAIELGRRGEADALLVHSPAAETMFVAEGTAGQRRLVMHNDFVLVGPEADPAGVRGDEPAAALAGIADAEATFISRGDESGTHTFELGLWEDAAVDPAGVWYQESGQGMGATLQIANDKQAYTVTDRGTYLATDAAKGLEILVEGGADLLNVYRVIAVADDAGKRVNAEGGKALADFLVAPEAQEIIADFGAEEFGEPLFVPDAGKTDDEIRAEA